jgi:hypothetical protein
MNRFIITLLTLVSLSSCVTQRVQDRTLLPAIESAWPGVRDDAELGGMEEGQLLLWDVGVETGSLLGLDAAGLESAALIGVDLRLVAGEIGPIGAGIMRDRARSFRSAVEEYTRVAVVTPARRDYVRRPLVISRSSWATSPPPAIAGRTYR